MAERVWVLKSTGDSVGGLDSVISHIPGQNLFSINVPYILSTKNPNQFLANSLLFMFVYGFIFSAALLALLSMIIQWGGRKGG